MNKFTFKKEQRENGLASVGHPYASTKIKLDGKIVGSIGAPNWRTPDNKWSICLTVKCEPVGIAENCVWKWVFLNRKFDSEPGARVWLNDNFGKIMEKFRLHSYLED